MDTNCIDSRAIDKLNGLLANDDRVVITCHMSPDGDAIGSSLALMRVLELAGGNAAVVTPDTPPRILSFLPGADKIIVASRFPDRARNMLMSASVVFCLDYNALYRVDRLAPMIEASEAPRVLIDHHLSPEAFADVVISCPESSSTCALLYKVLCLSGLERFIDKDVATCIYTGMLTDTGNFAYNSNDPDLYEIISDLMRRGIDKDRIYKLVWNTSSLDRLRLCAYATYEKLRVIPEHRMALITLSREELNRFNYVKGDTESLVNVPLSIPDVVYSVFMRQDEDNYVKISTRSEGSFPVNRLCEEQFGGGGHLNAAGGEFRGSLEDAEAKLMSVLSDYDCFLPENEI